MLTTIYRRIYQRNRIALVILLLGCLFPLTKAIPSLAQDNDSKAKSLAVLNYQTGWSLDGAGYHPAVYLLLENTSGRDLSLETIKFQGKFTDIHTLEPSIARLEIRRALKPMQQFSAAVVAPQAYELPRDVSYWPVMECKIMTRIGSVGDEGTEYLLITRIDSVTATEEDAFQKLNQLTSYNRRSAKSNPSKSNTNKSSSNNSSSTDKSSTDKTNANKNNTNQNNTGQSSSPSALPLLATAGKLKPAPTADNSDSSDLFNQKGLPGLGDDFYNFEQSFGLPVATDARRKDMTWAKFRHQSSSTDIMVGSRENTSKADIIIILIPKNQGTDEKALLERVKTLAGKFKTQSLGQSVKSVKYLPSGRLEVLTASALGYRICLLKPPAKNGAPGNVILVLTRLPKEADVVVRSHIKENEVLKTLPIDPD